MEKCEALVLFLQGIAQRLTASASKHTTLLTMCN